MYNNLNFICLLLFRIPLLYVLRVIKNDFYNKYTNIISDKKQHMNLRHRLMSYNLNLSEMKDIVDEEHEKIINMFILLFPMFYQFSLMVPWLNIHNLDLKNLEVNIRTNLQITNTIMFTYLETKYKEYFKKISLDYLKLKGYGELPEVITTIIGNYL
jgi:hypothetical protein